MSSPTTEPTRRVVVGTAGHIDHGKTHLVQALTGIDCDRWAEEKARGITIDLGFAHLRAGDLQIGFIDVPGHERFVHNALAGLGGIRILLLVVAADEGVKPQTEEHLAICSLLDIPAAVVALTKADLVDPDLLELAQLEIEELLSTTPFASARVMPVSSLTGDGIAELSAYLVELAQTHAVPPDSERPVRLPIDRAFHLKGLGLTVTGTLVSGVVAPGDELQLLPGGEKVRVRDVQVHGEPRAAAHAGERASLRLTGIERADIDRGDQLATPGALATSRDLCGELTLLADAPAPIKGFVPVRLHLYAAEVIGKMRPLGTSAIAPGETAAVELRLSAPVTAVAGDRFIVRRPSPQTTLGGGVVLDPAWHRQRGHRLNAMLTAFAGSDADRLVAWVSEAGEGGTGADELARRLGRRREGVHEQLTALAADGKLLTVPNGPGGKPRWLTPAAYRHVAERATKVLGSYFATNRLARGISKAEAVERILPGRAAELASVYLDWLTAQKILVVDGDLINKPGRSASLTGQESSLSTALIERFDAAGLTPPSPADIGRQLGAKPQILTGMLTYLIERGRLIKLPGGLLVSGRAIEQLRADLRATDWERFTVPQFKERFGLSRKWAIPLLEYLDSSGATRRLGDERLVVRSG